jgi:hypothetical protein
MAAPQSFVALCAAPNIPVEGTKKKIEHFLRDAGVASPSNNSLSHLKDVAASVAWARNSISNGADPDSWINAVGPAGVALLQTLYPLPPTSNPGDSESKRLARSMILYMATGSIPAQQPTNPLQHKLESTDVATYITWTPPSNTYCAFDAYANLMSKGKKKQ